MKLEEFALGLKKRFNVDIETITAEQPDILARTSRLTVIMEGYVHELKRFVIKYKFSSINEEIEFFKSTKPEFAGLLRYYRKLFQVQLFETYNSTEARLKYYRYQLKRLQSFMDKYSEYYHYILSSSGHMDEKYFTTGSAQPSTAAIDDRFSTPYEIRLSKLFCNERLMDYLKSAIEKIEKPTSPPSPSALTWTGSKTDLIELIYALQAAGVFNKKDADVKEIATHFENVFNVSLGNYYRVFQEIRQRKTGQVNFMNQLKDVLIERIREADS